MESPTAIVVHQDRHVRSYLRMLLCGVGVAMVGEAAEFGEALGLCRAQRPTLVLVDVDRLALPLAEAMQQLRAIEPGVGVLAVTAQTDAAFLKTPGDLGALDRIPIQAVREEIARRMSAAVDGLIVQRAAQGRLSA